MMFQFYLSDVRDEQILLMYKSSIKYKNFDFGPFIKSAKTEPTAVVDLKKYCIMRVGFTVASALP